MSTNDNRSVSAFVADETNPANGPTPTEALSAAISRVEAVAYARGFEAALSRLEMIAAIVPESVTKAQLVEIIQLELQACMRKWKSTPKYQPMKHLPKKARQHSPAHRTQG